MGGGRAAFEPHGKANFEHQTSDMVNGYGTIIIQLPRGSLVHCDDARKAYSPGLSMRTVSRRRMPFSPHYFFDATETGACMRSIQWLQGLSLRVDGDWASDIGNPPTPLEGG